MTASVSKVPAILYEAGRYYVIRATKGFEVYRNGTVVAERCAIVGYEGPQGFARARAEADRRATIENRPTIEKAATEAEAALGENLVWLADRLDLFVRQKDPETLRRLKQLNDAWVSLARAGGRQ